MTENPTILLTVLIPCFNEGAIINSSAKRVLDYLENQPWQCSKSGTWELLFVDDGSTDDSRNTLANLAAKDSRIRFISYRPNAGQGNALRRGFASARGEWIFCVDADLDYGPEHIQPYMLAAVGEEADIIVGSAYMPGGTTTGVPISRYLMSRVMNWYFSRILSVKLHTYTSILRLYRRSAIKDMLLTTRDKDLLPEILIKANLLGLSVIEMPAHLKWRETIKDDARTGASIMKTAGKALRHILWGALENPLAFFAAPAIVVGVGTIWFGLALIGLFFRAYAAVNSVGLQGLTDAASHIVINNPQTVIIFTVCLLAALLLFTVSLVTLQNKIKIEQDFIYFSEIAKAIRDSENRAK